jgi:pimeloyl-ACP methyl ester carboxylesterase
MFRSLVMGSFFSGAFLSHLLAEEWSYSAPPTERDSFLSAEFRLYLDDQIVELKGVIVLLGPQDTDMRNLVRSSPWERLAKQQECAVLGCKFVNKPNQDFSQVDQGGRAALLACLIDFSRKSSRIRDLDRLKLLLVGNLAGAQFAYEFANRESNRVAGFVAINPYYFKTPPSSVLRKVPALFLVEKDAHPISAANVTKLYLEQRRVSALWAMVSWDDARRPKLDLMFAAPFVEQTLIARIKRKNPIGVLESLTLNDGWSLDLSQFTTPTITDSRNVPRGQEEKYAWFVSENLAEAVAKLVSQLAAAN